MNSKTITQSIIQRFKDGDEEAFKVCYRYFYNKIYYYSFHCLNDHQLAEDVVHNTFITAYQQREQLKHLEAFHVWIMRVATGECNKLMRKNDVVISLDVVTPPLLSEKSDDVEVNKVIATAINALTIPLRQVAQLKYLEDFQDAEIAEILSIPVGTVKSRLFKIRKKLQAALRSQDITPQTYRSYAFGIPALVATYYARAFENTQAAISLTNPEVPKEVATTVGTIVASSKVGLLSKMVAAAAVTVTATLIILNIPKPKTEEPFLPPVETILAVIEDVKYDREFTNQPITIMVELTLGEFDYFTINGEETDVISDNGYYTVDLIRNDVIIDSRSITVSNIDKAEPKLKSHTYVNQRAQLSVVDDNGLKQVEIYKDNNMISERLLANTESLIEIDIETGSNYEVHVFDQAGNKLKIRVYESE